MHPYPLNGHDHQSTVEVQQLPTPSVRRSYIPILPVNIAHPSIPNTSQMPQARTGQGQVHAAQPNEAHLRALADALVQQSRARAGMQPNHPSRGQNKGYFASARQQKANDNHLNGHRQSFYEQSRMRCFDTPRNNLAGVPIRSGNNECAAVPVVDSSRSGLPYLYRSRNPGSSSRDNIQYAHIGGKSGSQARLSNTSDNYIQSNSTQSGVPSSSGSPVSLVDTSCTQFSLNSGGGKPRSFKTAQLGVTYSKKATVDSAIAPTIPITPGASYSGRHPEVRILATADTAKSGVPHRSQGHRSSSTTDGVSAQLDVYSESRKNDMEGFGGLTQSGVPHGRHDYKSSTTVTDIPAQPDVHSGSGKNSGNGSKIRTRSGVSYRRQDYKSSAFMTDIDAQSDVHNGSVRSKVEDFTKPNHYGVPYRRQDYQSYANMTDIPAQYSGSRRNKVEGFTDLTQSVSLITNSSLPVGMISTRRGPVSATTNSINPTLSSEPSSENKEPVNVNTVNAMTKKAHATCIIPLNDRSANSLMDVSSFHIQLGSPLRNGSLGSLTTSDITHTHYEEPQNSGDAVIHPHAYATHSKEPVTDRSEDLARFDAVSVNSVSSSLDSTYDIRRPPLLNELDINFCTTKSSETANDSLVEVVIDTMDHKQIHQKQEFLPMNSCSDVNLINDIHKNTTNTESFLAKGRASTQTAIFKQRV